MLVEAVLAAAEGEEERVRGRLEGDVAEVAALSLSTVATANEEDVLEVALGDGVKDGTGNGEDGLVAKADSERGLGGGLRLLLGEAIHGEGLADDGGEVANGTLGRDLLDAGPADSADGVDAVLVGLAGLDNAVGGHHDWSGELAELELLELPSATVVAGEVLVLLELGVAVRGELWGVVRSIRRGRMRELREGKSRG